MHFDKIHANGNDFILLHETQNRGKIHELCNRRLGLGADGILVFHPGPEGNRLEHYDCDGSSSYCLNGTRAAIDCLYRQNLIPQRGIIACGDRQVPYHVRETPVLFLEKALFSPRTVVTQEGTLEGYFLDVGNPHLILLETGIETFRKVAKEIRHNPMFPKGVNVHLVHKIDGKEHIFSYERGVEDFTLSCGSGALAAACLFFSKNQLEAIELIPEGGGSIYFKANGPIIAMQGEVSWVARGEWLC